jgi:hypothetical protein
MNKTRTKWILIASGMLWLLAVGSGLGMLWKYQNTAGANGVPPSLWPSNSQIKPTSGRATLVMLAHPRCPCTRASIGELALLMAQCQGRVSAYVLFLRPRDFPDGWEKTDLWQSAASIPGVTALIDEGGLEARRFNAETSGQTILYDAEGQLLFSGGITDSRGHSGDNEGRSAIVAVLNGQQTSQSGAPVFGCSIIDVNQVCGDEETTCRK